VVFCNNKTKDIQGWRKQELMAEESATKKDTKSTRAAKAAAAKAAATARRRAAKTVQTTTKTTRLDGFLLFMREQGVVGLAIGIVIGTQAKVLVDQLIASFVNPVLGLVLPGQGDLSQKKFTLTISEVDKTAVFAWGQFVYVLISFIAVAAIIYYIIRGLKLDKVDKKKD
jgi:large conductance mechanosensitive channel